MPLNASSLESKSQEFTFVGFNDMAFGRVNDQFKALLQVPADAVEYAVSGTSTLYQNHKVVGVSGKLMTALFQFFVQRVEHGIGQQG